MFGNKAPCFMIKCILRYHPDKIAVKARRLSNNVPNKNTENVDAMAWHRLQARK